MTGNQPGHDDLLPRSALLAERAAYPYYRTYVLILSRVEIKRIASEEIENQGPRARTALPSHSASRFVDIHHIDCGMVSFTNEKRRETITDEHRSTAWQAYAPPRGSSYGETTGRGICSRLRREARLREDRNEPGPQ